MRLEVLAEAPELMPTKGTEDSAGLDLYAKETVFFHDTEKAVVGTGIKVKIPKGAVGLLVARSSLQKKNLQLANNIGIIDSDYRGEIKVILQNTSSVKTSVLKGDKFAQLVVVPHYICNTIEYTGTIEDWEDTARGSGGFGSTGR